MSPTLMHINRMDLLSVSTATLLRLDYLCLLMHICPLNFGMKLSSRATYLINRIPTKILDFPLLLNDCFMRNQIIVGCEPLVVLVGLIFDPSTHTNFSSV
jgi:hypothetical protein